ncbi:MAG: hypothetical protein K2F84_06280, partial [Bacteroidales bacterium]|nr:hypothetical protein [Bacteroidales bacterium]
SAFGGNAGHGATRTCFDCGTHDFKKTSFSSRCPAINRHSVAARRALRLEMRSTCIIFASLIGGVGSEML